MMGTPLRIAGAIDRHDPDPTAQHDNLRTWIGLVTVAWTGAVGPEERSAAILKVATGRGTGDAKWGPYALMLRWIGDPPDPEIAQTVYDVILDGGPVRRDLSGAWMSQPRTPAQPSYRAARA